MSEHWFDALCARHEAEPPTGFDGFCRRYETPEAAWSACHRATWVGWLAALLAPDVGSMRRVLDAVSEAVALEAAWVGPEFGPATLVQRTRSLCRGELTERASSVASQHASVVRYLADAARALSQAAHELSPDNEEAGELDHQWFADCFEHALSLAESAYSTAAALAGDGHRSAGMEPVLLLRERLAGVLWPAG